MINIKRIWNNFFNSKNNLKNENIYSLGQFYKDQEDYFNLFNSCNNDLDFAKLIIIQESIFKNIDSLKLSNDFNGGFSFSEVLSLGYYIGFDKAFLDKFGLPGLLSLQKKKKYVLNNINENNKGFHIDIFINNLAST